MKKVLYFIGRLFRFVYATLNTDGEATKRKGPGHERRDGDDHESNRLP